MSNTVLYAGVILLLLTNSCKSKQIDADRTPRIIFLNYTISQKSDRGLNIQLINKIIREGKLKQGLSNKKEPETGDLRIIQSNAKSKPIESIIIANPLVKTVEYADESGKLNKKIIELDSTQFSLRMQLNHLTKYIIIEQTNKQNKRLTKNKL